MHYIFIKQKYCEVWFFHLNKMFKLIFLNAFQKRPQVLPHRTVNKFCSFCFFGSYYELVGSFFVNINMRVNNEIKQALFAIIKLNISYSVIFILTPPFWLYDLLYKSPRKKVDSY